MVSRRKYTMLHRTRIGVNGIMYFLGVTGFDGLYLERCATQCSPANTLKGQGNILAKNTLASVKSPYFGMSNFAFAFAKV